MFTICPFIPVREYSFNQGESLRDWLVAGSYDGGVRLPYSPQIKRSEMENLNIKDLIKDNVVTINRYRAQHIYYDIAYNRKQYTFPVPLEDIQEATLNHTEKAITLMRYIRKAINNGTFVEEV